MASQARLTWSLMRSLWSSGGGVAGSPASSIYNDRGTEYTSHALERELRRHGALASMGPVADCYDTPFMMMAVAVGLRSDDWRTQCLILARVDACPAKALISRPTHPAPTPRAAGRES